MSRLLINEPPLQVLPSLAVKVGLNEAIILQQVHYWAERSKVEIDGHLWVYNTIQQWREQFPFWSDDTIGRALKSLRESGLVIAARLSKDPFNKTLYYRIDYRNLQASEDAGCAAPITASCGNRSAQDASLSITETTVTETTTERAPRKRRTAPAAPDGVSEKVWSDWLAVRREKKAAVTDTAIGIIKTEADKAGYTMQQALETCCSRGWSGFKAAWVADADQGQQGRSASPESFRAQDERIAAESVRRLTGGLAHNRAAVGETSPRELLPFERGYVAPVETIEGDANVRRLR